MKKKIKIALPKGRLLAETARLLQTTGWGLSDYAEGTRLYHLKATNFPELFAKVFNERDIPVQVAIGNYDLGICGLDWIEEQTVKYPSSALVKVEDLGYGQGSLYMAASLSGACTLDEIRDNKGCIRIASEYPNLAEAFAAKNRFRRFSIYPLWGAAEVYPPESADLALVADRVDSKSLVYDLVPVGRVLDFSAYLISNRDSWENRDMGNFLLALLKNKRVGISLPSTEHARECSIAERTVCRLTDDIVRVALPDGHQQSPANELLKAAGIEINNYRSSGGNRRPTSNLDGVAFKVIRPQDMPLQVANGNFNLAITGKDWLKNHLYQFPSSPVTELLDLKFARVRIVAIVSNSLPVDNIAGLRYYCSERSSSLRIASEYTNIADKYARDKHLGMYRIIPTWGATETFIPDDADLLIENTQTGKTLAKNNLKIVDTLFESTGCLIGNTENKSNRAKYSRIKAIIAMLRSALGD